MKVSYRWLKALAPTLEDGPEALAERLASLGAPVEEMWALGEGLAGVRVARVLSVRKHPDADRLSLCQVDGGDGVVQVVCGAPNVRADAWYPFAPVGTVLPGDVTIRKAKIRGEVSEGMLCSEKELGLGRDQAGILELQGDFVPGEPLVSALALDDWRLDVEVTSNRPDLLSHRGIAREVAPGGDADLVFPSIPGGTTPELTLRNAGGPVEVPGIRLTIEDPELCPRYLGAVIRGVRVGPSPRWLADRLRAAGARPINNVVDATNYVLLELGQPLHAFDLARLEGGEIRVRRARKGETIRTLDGEERRLQEEMLCICDAERPVAVAGVMGGEDSEVSDTTTDVLLECALFAPASVRATRRALGMNTDASHRFERGVDPEGLETALRRCVEVILATAGGRAEPLVADAHPTRWARSVVRLRPSRVERILGVPFGPESLRERLEPLGFPVREGSDGALLVEVPGFRSWDVRREIDLIEEVARTHGYDRFPAELGPFRPGTVPDDPLLQLQDGVRDHLVARGFLEALTLAFAPPSDGEVEVLNPLSVEESRLRGSLLPALLRRVSYNFHRGNRDVRLFEIGTVFLPAAGEGELPREEMRVAVVLTGARTPAHWSGGGEPLDFWDLKGLLEELAAQAGLQAPVIRPGGDGGIGDLQVSLGVWCDSGPVGWGGRVRDGVVDAPPWAGPVWALELTLPAEPPADEPVMYRSLPVHPAVERDLALLLPRGTEVGSVTGTLREAGGALLESVAPFDLYDGPGVPEGHRSVAWRLVFRAPDRTLVDADVASVVTTILNRLREVHGVRPRT